MHFEPISLYVNIYIENLYLFQMCIYLSMFGIYDDNITQHSNNNLKYFIFYNVM